MRFLKSVLRLFLPKWIIEDLFARFSHPYWKRKAVISKTVPSIAPSAGLTGKYEKFSSRRPFKRINEEHVLKVLHNAGARCILDI
ncbi:MAG: hypothetical protein ACYSWP_07905, partial [Planctomycetota bacterium]